MNAPLTGLLWNRSACTQHVVGASTQRPLCSRRGALRKANRARGPRWPPVVRQFAQVAARRERRTPTTVCSSIATCEMAGRGGRGVAAVRTAAARARITAARAAKRPPPAGAAPLRRVSLKLAGRASRCRGREWTARNRALARRPGSEERRRVAACGGSHLTHAGSACARSSVV